MPAAHAQPPAGHSRPQDTTATQQWGRTAEDSSSQPNRGQPAQAPVPRASESQPLPTMGLPPATSNIDNAWLETCATLSRVRAGGQNVAIGSRLPNFRKPVYQELPSISAYNAGRENTGILNKGNPATQPIPNPPQQQEDFGDLNFNNPSMTGQNSLNTGLGLGLGQGPQAGGNNSTLGMSTYSAAGPLLGSTAPVGHLMSAPPQSNSLYSANYDISNPAPAPSAPASMNDTQASRGGYNPTFNPSPFTEHIQFPKGIPVHSQKEEAPPIPVPPVSTDPLFDIEGMVNLMSQGMGAPFAPLGAGQFGGPPSASVPPSHPRLSLSKEHSAGTPTQPQSATQPPLAAPAPAPTAAPVQSFGLSSGGGRAYPSPHQTRPGRPHSPSLRSGSPGRIQAAQPAATNTNAPSTPSRSAQPPTHASFGHPHDASRENSSIGQLNRSQNSSSAPHPKGNPPAPTAGPFPHHHTTHTYQNKEYHHQRRGSGGQPGAPPQAAGGVSPMKPPGGSLGPQPEAHTTGGRSASTPSQGSRRHSNGSIPSASQQHPHLQRAPPPNASLRPPPSTSKGMPQPGQPQHGYPSPAPTPSGQQAQPTQSAPSMRPRSSSPAPLAPPNDGRRLSGNRNARAPSGGPGATRQPPAPQQKPPQGPGTQAVVPAVAPPSAPSATSATPPPQSGGLFNRRPSTGSTGKPARLLGSWLKKRPSDPSPASPPPSSGRGATPPPPRSSLGGRIADNSTA